MHWHCGRYAKAHSFGHTAGEIAMDGNGTALLAGVAGALVGVNKDVWYWCAACSVSKCHRHSFVEPNRKTESPYFHCRLWSKAFGSKSSMEMNFIFHFTNIVSAHKKIAATVNNFLSGCPYWANFMNWLSPTYCTPRPQNLMDWNRISSVNLSIKICPGCSWLLFISKTELFQCWWNGRCCGLPCRVIAGFDNDRLEGVSW